VSAIFAALDLITGVPEAIGTEVVSLAVNDAARSLWSRIKASTGRNWTPQAASTIKTLEAGHSVPVVDLVRVLGMVPGGELSAIVADIRRPVIVNVASATGASRVVVRGDVAGRDLSK
jgi:hypothetical protein